MKTYLTIIMLTTSCGSSNSGSGSGSPTVEHTETEVQNAALVNSEDDRPECKKKSQLIYVVDKEEFQSCDGKGNWAKIELIKKTTTTTNTYTAHNVYTDAIQGKDWLIIYSAQKSKVQAGTICPTGYSIASKSQVEFVATQTSWVYGLALSYATTLRVWASEMELANFSTVVLHKYTSVNWMTAAATTGIAAYTPDNWTTICVK